MPLQPGTRLGPYEVTAAIGAGGMGEVYRARDTKLNRDVALKIVPESFAGDADRLARFEREAQTLAALNHPNIAQVFGLEDRAIVMELVQGDDLVAQPFDATRRTLSGEPVPLGDTPGELNLEYSAGAPASVARTGALDYLSAAEMRSRLVWLDQAGREVGTVAVPAGPYTEVALSPNGRRAVVAQLAAPEQSLWWVDVERGGLTPLSQAPGWNGGAVWSGDGQQVAFDSDRTGPSDIYARSVAAADDELLYASDVLFKSTTSWSQDGQVIVFSEGSPETDNDLWTLRPDGDRTPELFLRTTANDAFGTLSPDGDWMVYITDQAGGFDAYVQAFPSAGAPHRITTGGTLDWGMWWRADGRQLLIVDSSLQLLLVDIVTSPEFSASTPTVVGQLRFPVLTAALAGGPVSATPDLQRLLAIVPDQADGSRSLTVVSNWQQGMGR